MVEVTYELSMEVDAEDALEARQTAAEEAGPCVEGRVMSAMVWRSSALRRHVKTLDNEEVAVDDDKP